MVAHARLAGESEALTQEAPENLLRFLERRIGPDLAACGPLEIGG